MKARSLRFAAVVSALLAPSAALSSSCAKVGTVTGADASTDAASDAVFVVESGALSTCPPKPVAAQSAPLPRPKPRPTNCVAQFVDGVIGCDFSEVSGYPTEECRKSESDFPDVWRMCRECLFVDDDAAAPDGSSEAVDAGMAPIGLDQGLVMLNVGVCLTFVARERGTVEPGGVPSCAIEYARNQWCERKACAECAVDGGVHAYDECRARTADGACPAISVACALEADDAGCQVQPDFYAVAKAYGYRLCATDYDAAAGKSGDAGVDDAD